LTWIFCPSFPNVVMVGRWWRQPRLEIMAFERINFRREKRQWLPWHC
jgi:hypothetical protein